MISKPTKSGVRLPNGDVLVPQSTQRDAKVDAAFKTAFDAVRERNAARFAELRRVRRQAA
jgi:hypothetical protein